jgi:AraC-like DNA-binding protein
MAEPSHRELPERACASFERLTGLDLCIHDLQGLLWGHVSPHRFQHLRQPCLLVKRHDQHGCTVFDVDALYPHLAAHPQGVVKRCFAGVVEVALEVRAEGRLWLVLFAGAWRARPGFRPDLDSPDRRPGPWEPQVAALAPGGDQDLAAALELLHQLAARLSAWRRERTSAERAVGGHRTRRETILRWIQNRHCEQVSLADLARDLGLSVDRASHAVGEACGSGFAALMADERLRTASELLRTTDLPVREVIAASGFRNRAHFHQVFRRHLGTSPARWRRSREA